MSEREIRDAREDAEDALDEYARLAFGWNAPDDEHTRHSLRLMVERAIAAHDPSSSGGGTP
jgi:hypothetical protein